MLFVPSVSWRPRLLGLGAVVIAIAVAPAQASAACSADGAQYSTTFAQRDDTWDLNDNMKIGGGQMTITEKAGDGDTAFFNGDAFTSGTLCADFTLTSQSDKEPSAGLTFWASSYKDYYIFQVDPIVGTFALQRKKDGTWLNPIPWKSSPAVKNGVGAVNELSVQFSGNRAALSINGQQVADITGFPPSDPGKVGTHGEGGAKAGAVWSVTNFVVAK
jgi:hypothetical protein